MDLYNVAPYFLIMAALAVLSQVIVRTSRFYGALTEAGQGRLAALDGFRGFLALGVFFHHAVTHYRYLRGEPWDWPASRLYTFLGPGAVVFFFMITGLLFWSKALDGKAGARRLLRSRVRRIMPMYLVCCAAVYILVLVLGGWQWREAPWQVACEAGRWLAGGVLGSPDINGINTIPINAGVTWTLQYEWGFYLLLPLLAVVFAGRRFVLLWVGACGYVVVLKVFPESQGLRDGSLACLPFLCGMTAAYGARSPGWRAILCSRACSVLMVALLGVSGVIFQQHQSLATVALMWPVFVAVACGNNLFGLLTARWAIFLGHISYSIYLSHGIILFGMIHLLHRVRPLAQVTPLAYWWYCLPVAMLVVVSAAVTYRFVEAPFLQHGEGKRRDKIPEVGAVAAKAETVAVG